jgi:lysophospholipase L1-like esterase
MSRFSKLLRGAIGLGAMAAIAACGDADGKILRPVNPPGGALMSSYVALGNSITAGWQSGGLNDSVQRNSYAFLVAQQAGTRFAYPSFTKSFKAGALTITTGCPPLLGNWATQKLTDSLVPTPSGCALRDASKATDILNNVAVPFAYASDLLVTGSGIKIPSATVHTLILGGKAQVDRALDAEPTFVSLWIGNNETLSPATVGMTTGAPSLGAPALVPASEFAASFNAAVDSLVKGSPAGLQGILIGAVKVGNAPRFFSADSLVGPNAAARLAAIGTFTGKGPPAVVGCGAPGVTGWLVSSELIKAIRSGQFPANAIVCNPLATPGGAGDIFVLDPTEQAALNAATDAYNVTISDKATALGWAYLDPNPALAASRAGATPAIPAFPNFTSNTRDAATAPFGALFSLDGVHPSAAGQKIIANLVIGAINTKYNLQIPIVP